MQQQNKNTPANIHRDISFTVLAGPLKFIVPLISYAFLYPLLLAKFGSELLGLWSLLYSIVALIGAGDVGFSQLLTREAGQGRSSGELQNAHADYIATNRSYHVITALLVFLFLLFRAPLLSSVQHLYSIPGLTISIVLVITGSMIQLGGKLDAAILAARQDNFIIQLIYSFAPIFVFIPCIIGALIQKPLEGLGIGICLSGLFARFIFAKRLRRKHTTWTSYACSCSLADSYSRAVSLCRRGWHFYALSLGMMLRGPVVRFIIASSIGLSSVAVFEIAMRLTQTMRDLIANGFSVLYPSFGYFFRKGDQEQLIETARLSIITLIPVGALALATIICGAEVLFAWWLPDTPELLVISTVVLSAWQLITLFNVPFWYMLQAAGLEKVASWSVWMHTLLICALYPLSIFADLNILDFCIYWTLSSLLTQFMIYSAIEKQLSLFFIIIKETRTLVVTASSVLFYALALLITGSSDTVMQITGYYIPLMIVFLGINVICSFRPIAAYIRKVREKG